MTALALAALVLACAYLLLKLRQTKQESTRRLQEANAAGTSLAAISANNQQKLKALSDSSGAGIVMLDERGKIVHTNANADRILGCDPDSMVGRALIQATLSSELQDFVVQAAAGRAAQTRDFQMSGAPPRILRASVYPFQEGLSGVAETMVVLVDVTELRRLEMIRRDFVANVSHELRTPLASIRAMAETLQDGALGDEEVADRFLGTIISEADRLARISEDLLILSDAESKTPTKEPFDLDALIREIVSRSKSFATERGIEVSLHLNGRLPVCAARDQMEQVIVNLLDNAIKYTPQGGQVAITARRTATAVRVEVKDTGIGIMQEHLPRLFERFYRVDKARSRESGGTGLGLSIVKNIIEAHGGEVTVESELHRGSTFAITLPQPENATCP